MSLVYERPPFIDSAGVSHNTSSPCTKEGWLMKESKWLKEWRRRYFVLKDSKLFFFKDEYSSPHGMVDLSNDAIVRDTYIDGGKEFGFEIKTKDEHFEMHADSESEREEWIALINHAIASHKPENQNKESHSIQLNSVRTDESQKYKPVAIASIQNDKGNSKNQQVADIENMSYTLVEAQPVDQNASPSAAGVAVANPEARVVMDEKTMVAVIAFGMYLCCFFCFIGPFIIGNFIYAFREPECMNQRGSVGFSMKEYLLVDASVMSGVFFLFMFVTCGIACHSAVTILASTCGIVLVSLFVGVWSIMGMILLWGQLDRDKCSTSTFNYLTAMFVIRLFVGVTAPRDSKGNNNNNNNNRSNR